MRLGRLSVCLAIAVGGLSACFAPVSDEPRACNAFAVSVPFYNPEVPNSNPDDAILTGTGELLFSYLYALVEPRARPTGLARATLLAGRVVVEGVATVVSLDGGVARNLPSIDWYTGTFGVSFIMGPLNVVNGRPLRTYGRDVTDGGVWRREYGIAEMSADLLSVDGFVPLGEVESGQSTHPGQVVQPVLQSPTGSLRCEGWLAPLMDGEVTIASRDARVSWRMAWSDALTCSEVGEPRTGEPVALLRGVSEWPPVWRLASMRDGGTLSRALPSSSCRLVPGANVTTVACVLAENDVARLAFLDADMNELGQAWPVPRSDSDIVGIRLLNGRLEILVTAPQSPQRDRGAVVLLRDGLVVGSRAVGLAAAAAEIDETGWLLVYPGVAVNSLEFVRWCEP